MITADTQRYGDRILTLKDFITDESKLNFPKYYLPNITNVNDTLFIIPSKHVVSSNDDYYIKYLILDKDKMPIHGHSYPFVEVPNEGYIMKIRVEYTNIEVREFQIEYMVDINDIKFNVTSSLIGTDENKSKIDTFTFTPFDSSMCSQTLANILTDQNAFYQSYIHDAIQ